MGRKSVLDRLSDVIEAYDRKGEASERLGTGEKKTEKEQDTGRDGGEAYCRQNNPTRHVTDRVESGEKKKTVQWR